MDKKSLNGQKGKIGIFDSGLGGLTILKEIVKTIPNNEYIYLGDNKNMPYGDKSQDKIFNLTLAGVEWLFKNGAEIIILACNTASANALRRIQQEVLPIKYPNKRVLGVIIPTIEEIKKYTESEHIGILATKATIESKIYEIEMEKQKPEIKIIPQAGGSLANLIELHNDNELFTELKRVTDELLTKDDSIETVILGCTHYALIVNKIKHILPKHVRIVEQGKPVATKLVNYLNRHSEINNILSDSSLLNFYTTSDSDDVKQLMAYFYGEDLSVSTITL